jgi:hypothetical protein
MLACQPEGYEAVVFLLLLHIKILAKFQKNYKINRICTRKTKISQFLCLKIAKSCEKRKQRYEDEWGW